MFTTTSSILMINLRLSGFVNLSMTIQLILVILVTITKFPSAYLSCGQSSYSDWSKLHFWMNKTSYKRILILYG